MTTKILADLCGIGAVIALAIAVYEAPTFEKLGALAVLLAFAAIYLALRAG